MVSSQVSRKISTGEIVAERARIYEAALRALPTCLNNSLKPVAARRYVVRNTYRNAAEIDDDAIGQFASIIPERGDNEPLARKMLDMWWCGAK